jgi:hypothetical protein
VKAGMANPHYVYELVRTTPGPGASRYIGVRTAPNSDPEQDEYWSSSETIRNQMAEGAKFDKKILKTFASREAAEFYEAEMHWQYMVAKDPHFYNVMGQLIPGKVHLFLPRVRYRSPEGEYRWFKEGHEPSGWMKDPAKWAQYRDPSKVDPDFGAAFPQTYEGLELPEWEFNKYYPEEMAFSSEQPRHCYEPYVQLDYKNDITDCAYFPSGIQPSGWVPGFAPRCRVLGEPPAGWKLFFNEAASPQRVGTAFFPPREQPKGWLEHNLQGDTQSSEALKGRGLSSLTDYMRRLYLVRESDEVLRSRLRSFRAAHGDEFSSEDWEYVFNGSAFTPHYRAMIGEIIGRNEMSRRLIRAFDVSRHHDPQIEETIKCQAVFRFFDENVDRLPIDDWLENISHLDVGEADKEIARRLLGERLEYSQMLDAALRRLNEESQAPDPRALTDHISRMLAEAARLHNMAIASISSGQSLNVDQLREVLGRLEECELLAKDADSYFEDAPLRTALLHLQFQRFEIQKVLENLEHVQGVSLGSFAVAVFAIIVLALLVVFL